MSQTNLLLRILLSSVGHCQNLWCTQLVCHKYHHGEDSTSMSMGVQSRLGQPSTSTNWRRVDVVALSTEISLSSAHPSLLLSKTSTDCVVSGFSHASETVYAVVVYFQMADCDGAVYTLLIASKTKFAPIKRLNIPQLELCGAHLLTKLLEHVWTTLKIAIEQVCAWTDSTIVINWLDGNPRWFKTYVGNRVSFIIDRISTQSMEPCQRRTKSSWLCV